MMSSGLRNLSKSFEGNQVFNDISFAVPKGELSAIIGPNGAGKTTLFNLITGYLIPDKGRVIFKEKDISGMQPFDIVRLGMARAFQITNIFPRMSVLENVVTTIITKDNGNLNMITAVSKLKAVHERAYEVLENVGLADHGPSAKRHPCARKPEKTGYGRGSCAGTRAASS